MIRVLLAATVFLATIGTLPAAARVKPRPCQFDVTVRRGGNHPPNPMRSVRRAARHSRGRPAVWRLRGRPVQRPVSNFRTALRRAQRRGLEARLTRDLWGRQTTWRVKARSWYEAEPHRVARLIRCHAPKLGVSAAKSLAVASCESGLRWNARNGSSSATGVFQHLRPYWPARAEAAGLSGASIFDPFAQIHVTHTLVANGGWGPWECA